MNDTEKERLLCYSAMILGSLLSARQENESVVHEWMVRRSIKGAYKLINTIFNEESLKDIINNRDPVMENYSSLKPI